MLFYHNKRIKSSIILHKYNIKAPYLYITLIKILKSILLKSLAKFASYGYNKLINIIKNNLGGKSWKDRVHF